MSIKKVKKISKIKNKKKGDIIFLNPPTWKTLGYCLTQSLINTFRKCPRKFFYTVNRLTSKEGSLRSNFGNIVHYILGKTYLLKKIDNAENLIQKLLKNYEAENQEIIQNMDTQDFEVEKMFVTVVMGEYFKVYKKDFSEKNFVDVEKEIRIPFSIVNLLMKIDGKYKTKDKKNYLLETKTKGRISEDTFMKVLSFDTQNLTYILGAEKYYYENIDGVLHNVIRKPQIKPHKGEFLKDFGKRLQEDIQKRPEFYFMRYEIPYTKNDKISFSKELEAVINDIRSAIKNGEVEGILSYYKNSIACEFPFPCDFLNICSSKKSTGYTQKAKIFSELIDITDI